ncbi:MAG: hypothetical protein Alpg2KO_24020 [Alphaproteobacteria bacterium]
MDNMSRYLAPLMALSILIAMPDPAQAQTACLTDEADLMRRVHVTAQTCRAEWQNKLGPDAWSQLEYRRQRLNQRLLVQAMAYHPDRPRDELLAEIDCITSDCKSVHPPPVACVAGSAQTDMDILRRWSEQPEPSVSEPVLLIDPDLTRPAQLPLAEEGLVSPLGRLLDEDGLRAALRQIDIVSLNPACTDPRIRMRDLAEEAELVSKYAGQPVPFDLPDSTGVEDWVLTCKPDDQDLRYLRDSWQISECTGEQIGFDPYFYEYRGWPLWVHNIPWASEDIPIPNTRGALIGQLYFGIFQISEQTARFEPAPAPPNMQDHSQSHPLPRPETTDSTDSP